MTQTIRSERPQVRSLGDHEGKIDGRIGIVYRESSNTGFKMGHSCIVNLLIISSRYRNAK